MASSRFLPGRQVRRCWHAHSGRSAKEDRRDWRYAWAVKGTAGVLAASREIEAWARRRLGPRPDCVWYLPNVVDLPAPQAVELPGDPGSRVVCLANLRPEKDHQTLIAAFETVASRAPQAHLLLCGGTGGRAK